MELVISPDAANDPRVVAIDDHDNLDLGAALESAGDLGGDAASVGAEIPNHAGKAEGPAEHDDCGSAFGAKRHQLRRSRGVCAGGVGASLDRG